MDKKNFLRKIFILLIFLGLLFLLNVFYNYDLKKVDLKILQVIRLPRALLAISVGGILSVSAAVLQGVFRNPLVETYTLGISGGAGIGVALAISLGLNKIFGYYALPFFGFLGALAVFWLIYQFALRKRFFEVDKVLMIGVMISFISSALLMLILSLSKTESINNVIYWLMGSLDESDYFIVFLTLTVTLMILIVFGLISNRLNGFLLGIEKGSSLGINIVGLTKLTVFLACFSCAFAVSSSGIIPFVGIVVPHILKAIYGNDFRFLVPASFISGAAFMLFADLVARIIISPNELPVGVITGIIGGVIFINIYRKRLK